MSDEGLAAQIEVRLREVILTLVSDRGLEKSICPSEAARRVGAELCNGKWRMLMPLVRELAIELASDEKIVILQKGSEIPLDSIRGPIRLRLAQPTSAD